MSSSALCLFLPEAEHSGLWLVRVFMLSHEVESSLAHFSNRLDGLFKIYWEKWQPIMSIKDSYHFRHCQSWQLNIALIYVIVYHVITINWTWSQKQDTDENQVIMSLIWSHQLFGHGHWGYDHVSNMITSILCSHRWHFQMSDMTISLWSNHFNICISIKCDHLQISLIHLCHQCRLKSS